MQADLERGELCFMTDGVGRERERGGQILLHPQDSFLSLPQWPSVLPNPRNEAA